MSTLYSPDSAELTDLRVRFRDYYAKRRLDHPYSATAFRLGQFAREQAIPITDFGAHSRRWVEAFKRGRGNGTNTLTSRSELFNP